MPDKKEVENHVKYYNLKDTTPEEMMEDYYAEEEEMKAKELADAGYTAVGYFDKDTTDDEMMALSEKIADMME